MAFGISERIKRLFGFVGEEMKQEVPGYLSDADADNTKGFSNKDLLLGLDPIKPLKKIDQKPQSQPQNLTVGTNSMGHEINSQDGSVYRKSKTTG